MTNITLLAELSLISYPSSLVYHIRSVRIVSTIEVPRIAPYSEYSGISDKTKI
jgi:hypothetical protein